MKQCLGKMNVVAGSVDFLLLHIYSLKEIIIRKVAFQSFFMCLFLIKANVIEKLIAS